MNESQPLDSTQPIPDDSNGSKPPQPKRRPSGSSSRKALPRRGTTAQKLASATRTSAVKIANKTNREVDVLLGKIERAEDCNKVMEKYGKALLAVPDDQVKRLAVENPKACSIVFGIAGQNLQRLTEKAASPLTINVDLTAIAMASQRIKENSRRRAELEARLERLQWMLEAPTEDAVVDVPASAVTDGGQGEAKTMAANIESAEGQAKAGETDTKA